MTRSRGGGHEQRDPELLRIQELFHGLIRSRAQEGGLSIPKRLPKLSRGMITETEPRWFPVPGMCGGFAFRLQERGTMLQLVADSWSRVAEGSELRHVVTAKEVLLGMVDL